MGDLPSTVDIYKKKTKLHGLSPRANHTDRATAACRRSDCQLFRIEGATWSAWRISTAVYSWYIRVKLPVKRFPYFNEPETKDLYSTCTCPVDQSLNLHKQFPSNHFSNTVPSLSRSHNIHVYLSLALEFYTDMLYAIMESLTLSACALTISYKTRARYIVYAWGHGLLCRRDLSKPASGVFSSALNFVA
jgi:hypothetical protein